MFFFLFDAVVTVIAQALPIRFIPKQHGVAVVRDLVIDVTGRNHASMCTALTDAQRVLLEEPFACLLPTVIVQALVRGRP
jgi:hypothetical protein